MRSGRRHEHLLSFELPPRGAAPANIRIYLIFRETRIIGLHFPADSMSLFLFTFLQRVSIACYAERCISHDRFCLTV